jgi:hypothetical protein
MYNGHTIYFARIMWQVSTEVYIHKYNLFGFGQNFFQSGVILYFDIIK